MGTMVVLVNGVPQEGRLELKLTDVGNYSVERVQMQPMQDTAPKGAPPGPATVPPK